MDEKTQEVAVEQVELNPTELQAREAGWVPKTEFDGDEHKWVEAGEFLRRGELFSKIDTQSKELKRLQRETTALRKHYEQVRETEYQKALDTLRAEKKVALQEGDADAVIAAEEKIDRVKAQNAQSAREAAVEVQHNEPAPEFVEWSNKNQWYSTSSAMRGAADRIGIDLAGKGLSPSEVLREVEKQIKKEFPHKFTNPNRDKPSAVEGTSAPTRSAKKDSFELSDEQKQVMKTLVRSGILTEEKYIEDIKALNARKGR